VFLLLRGHNDPGGGFIGGLVAASAFTLYALAFGVPATREALLLDPRSLIGLGVTAALGSGCLALAGGKPLLDHRKFWARADLPGVGSVEVGTPLLFDLGVYLVVVGVALTIILPLAEE
jgi:multicomponent Na+:H+ antiporter subunit B